MKRSKGYLSGNTKKLTLKKAGKVTATRLIQDFKVGEKVVIDTKPYYKEGALPHPRYKGRVGIIKGKRGSHYIVEIKDGNKKKELLSSPIHLKKA